MDFKDALRQAASAAGWTPTEIAYHAGVSTSAVAKWLAGETEPRFSAVQKLRTKLPGFADMVDRGVTA